MLRRLAELLILPPASVLLLWLCGTVLRRFRPKLGRALQVFALGLLLLLSLPVTAGWLLGSLQTSTPLPATGPLPAAEAIVVLSAEADRVGAEYGRPVAGPMTMQRLRYGLWLHRRSGLPVLCSGGVPAQGVPALAVLMAEAAAEAGVQGVLTEDRSADTWENAAGSAELLRQRGMSRVLLVTSAWHMPRALAAFKAHGVEAVAAPTAFRSPPADGWSAWVPHWHGLRDSCLALHEWGGRLVYACR